MSEDVYTLPDLTKKARRGRGEKKVDLEEGGENEGRGEWEERIVDIYDTADSPKVHHPDPGTQQDAIQKNTAQEKHGDSDEAKKKNHHRVAAAGCVGVLCLLLLAAIIGVVVHYFELKEKNNNLAKELNEITARYSNLTDERGKLQTSFNNLTEEKDNLIIELNGTKTSYNNLSEEKNTLQTSLEQLQTSYENLTEETHDLKKRLCESYEFTFGGGLCYYLSTVENNWKKSREACEKKKSNLIVIKGQEKQDFVVSLKKKVWLGLSVENKGNWMWVDGTKLTEPKFWNWGEPNNPGTENCAEVKYGGWNNIACDGKNLYICERVI